jgi:hypothetical protein
MMMKRVLLFVLLSGVALTSAAQTPEGASVEVRGSQFQLPAQTYAMFPRDLENYTGAYHLSNGERMYIRRAGKRMFAEIGTRPAKELVATSANEFIALDRQVRMSFQENAGGDMVGDLLMVVPRTYSQLGGSDVIRLSVR